MQLKLKKKHQFQSQAIVMLVTASKKYVYNRKIRSFYFFIIFVTTIYKKNLTLSQKIIFFLE